MAQNYFILSCFIAIISYFNVTPSYLDQFPIYSPDVDWESNPNIFSEWPKIGISETKYNLKSLPVNQIHKYLPGTTRPIEYTIRLKVTLESDIDEEELTASGSVSILVKCVQPTKNIVLHADTNYLTILEDSVKITETLGGRPINTQIPILNQTFEDENNFYTIQLASACKANREYLLDINFVADIATDSLAGLYLSTYIDPATNITKRLAVTQFEAEWARQMFPHYDDPDYKAIFRMIIGRHENYNSLSNMNLIKTEPIKDLPGWFWDHFAPTPVMSSYLLALVVSDFTCVSAPPPGYKKYVDICGPPHMIEQGGGLHSAQVVATVLEYYDRFMKQKYPLPKMTSVAIPDFAAGAMENWGLNTYRIRGLLYFPGITTEEGRLRIDLTIAHELAHQNFGNLVTCKYWNQIWLNEGFATYISYFGLKSISPEYDTDTLWLSGYRRRALQTDGNPETHPLVNISRPMYYFDGISYAKGASLLKMVENFLTPRIFHEALQFYLAKHAYNTATQWDLFDILDRVAFASGVKPPVATVTEIMESWSQQTGYPLIRVKYINDRTISVSQERFFDRPVPNDSHILTNPPSYWIIPITFVYDNVTPISQLIHNVPQIWLTKDEPSKVINLKDKFDWIAVNHDATAFGRVLYDDELARRIENQLNSAHHTLTAITRAQVIEDAFETAWAGYGSIETALDFTKYLGKEREPVVWTAALNGLGKIYSMFVEHEEENLQLLKNYAYERISESLESIGIEQTSDEKGILVIHRSNLLNWAGTLEVPKVLEYATTLVQTWVESSVNVVPPDLHAQIYCSAVIGSDRGMHDTIVNLIRQEANFDVKQALATALACSKNGNTLQELRQNLTTEDLPQDLSYEVLMKLARNTKSRKTLVQYLDDNFNDIQTYFGGEKAFAQSLELAVQYWNSEVHLTEVKAFINKYEEELSSIKGRLKRVVGQIQKNISWKQQFYNRIKDWLSMNA